MVPGKGSARVKGRRVWKKWSHRDDKSNFRSAAARGGEPLPIVAFYMQSKTKLWRAETPRWPAHCATCWPEASLYHHRCRESGYLLLFKCISVPRRSAPPRPPPPWTAKFLRPPNIIQRTRSPLPSFGSWRNSVIFARGEELVDLVTRLLISIGVKGIREQSLLRVWLFV